MNYAIEVLSDSADKKSIELKSSHDLLKSINSERTPLVFKRAHQRTAIIASELKSLRTAINLLAQADQLKVLRKAAQIKKTVKSPFISLVDRALATVGRAKQPKPNLPKGTNA
jgi:hypothetical protein